MILAAYHGLAGGCHDSTACLFHLHEVHNWGEVIEDHVGPRAAYTDSW